MRFYDREGELERLGELYGTYRTRSVMVLISGRRRIGKTRLVSEFMERRKIKHLNFFFPVKEKGLVLQEFAQEVRSKLGYSPSFVGFDDFLGFLFESQDNLVVVFDEFQNIAKVDPGFSYSLQKYWDRNKDKKRFFLIITGSYIGVLKKLFENKKAPLYNRADAFFKIKPLPIRVAFSILDDLGVAGTREKIELYGILGGVPKYYELVESQKAREPLEVMKGLVAGPGAPLSYEGRNLLVEEFGKRYRLYFSILESITTSRNTLGEIASAIQQKPTTIMKQMIALEDYFELISRRQPVTEAKSKKSRYALDDYFLSFWFRFVHRNIRFLEESMEQALYSEIAAGFSQYFGRAFENVCKEILVELNNSRNLPFEFARIGGWWQAELEIDIVALNERTGDILFCDVEWKNGKTPLKALEDLRTKADMVGWKAGKRREHFALFSRGGFEKALEEKARMEGVLLFDLDSIGQILSGKRPRSGRSGGG